MLATMKVAKGVGLAAPQVGHSIRMLVFDIGSEFGIIINPEIIETEGLPEAGMEGCLSFPKEFCRVARYKKIKVQYIDLAGNTVVKWFEDLSARIVQHEMDHLEGVTMKQREEEQNDNSGNV
jgi:peptide deformylase